MKTTDHALSAVKAAANLIPVVGGAIASLINDYVPSSTQRSIDRGMILIGEKLKAVEDQIDPDAINKDEFAELFKSCYLVFVRTHQEEKLRAAAGIIANLMLKPGSPGKVPYQELDYLIRCVDALSIGAITFLGMVCQITTPFPQLNNRTDFGTVSSRFPEIDVSLLMSLAAELNSLNLIHMSEPGAVTYNFANYPIELTPIGARFVEHFLSEAPRGT